jgi:5-methylcytosine-specific restriction endonuclease McrA
MRTEQDTSTTYAELLQSTQWHNKRQIILKRDGNVCRNCGSTKSIEVHHRQYHLVSKTGEFRKPWEYSDSKLISLCTQCHKSGHKKFKVPVFHV